MPSDSEDEADAARAGASPGLAGAAEGGLPASAADAPSPMSAAGASSPPSMAGLVREAPADEQSSSSSSSAVARPAEAGDEEEAEDEEAVPGARFLGEDGEEYELALTGPWGERLRRATARRGEARTAQRLRTRANRDT